jgi:hypothetical protein
MFVTCDQVVAHLVGDYLLQSDWMANEKTKRNVAALAHGFFYALPFLLLTGGRDFSFFGIWLSHYIIDHLRLARYVVYAKNFLAPSKTLQIDSNPAKYARWWHPWSECDVTGYHKDRPVWLATWLYIIADNILHVLCNAAALRWL